MPVDPDAIEYVNANVGYAPTLDRDVTAIEYAQENVGLAAVVYQGAVEYGHYGDVNTLTPTPHIWFVRPVQGRAGDGIELVGGGLGSTQAQYAGLLQLEYPPWTTIPVTGWAEVAAGANAYTASRTIDPENGIIDMEHIVVEFLLPADAVPPGYRLRVRTDGP